MTAVLVTKVNALCPVCAIQISSYCCKTTKIAALVPVHLLALLIPSLRIRLFLMSHPCLLSLSQVNRPLHLLQLIRTVRLSNTLIIMQDTPLSIVSNIVIVNALLLLHLYLSMFLEIPLVATHHGITLPGKLVLLLIHLLHQSLPPGMETSPLVCIPLPIMPL